MLLNTKIKVRAPSKVSGARPSGVADLSIESIYCRIYKFELSHNRHSTPVYGSCNRGYVSNQKLHSSLAVSTGKQFTMVSVGRAT